MKTLLEVETGFYIRVNGRLDFVKKQATSNKFKSSVDDIFKQLIAPNLDKEDIEVALRDIVKVYGTRGATQWQLWFEMARKPEKLGIGLGTSTPLWRVRGDMKNAAAALQKDLHLRGELHEDQHQD